jgi:Tfp pilus assembly protein PilX
MDHDGKYIIEFRCFIDGAGTAKVITSEGDAFFRITAQGYSQDGESTVMVQSTYRLHLD